VRLYSLTNATAIDDPEHGRFVPDPDHGGFDLPDELAERLHSFHQRKRPAWETELERDERLHGEESARRRDPETLYNAVAGIADMARHLAALRDVPDAAKDDVAKLTAEVEALKAQLAAAQGAALPGDDAGEKPSRTRKPPAAKPAA